MSPTTLGFVLLILAALFGGSVPSVSKIVLEVFSPVTTIFLRVSITTVIFALMIGMSREPYRLTTFQKLWRVSLLLVINTACSIASLRFIPSALVPIIYATAPLMTIGIMKYQDPHYAITTRQVLGIIIGFIGMLVATYGSLHAMRITEHAWIGVGLILLGSFCFSLYGVKSKLMQVHYSPTHITYTMTLTAMLVTLPFAAYDFTTHTYLTQIALRHIVALIASGAIGTVAFYMCYQYAIKHTSAQAASLMTYIQPVFAVALSIILVGESVTPVFLIGACLAVGGAYLATKK